MNDQSLSQEINQAAEYYKKNYFAVFGPRFLHPDKRVVLGPKYNRVCRFCEKDETKTKFEHKAHAIPELLGNKSIFSNYECDDCNRFFGTGIENDLGNWTKISRTFSRIPGKRGVPSIQQRGPGKGFRIDYDHDGFHIKVYESKSPIVIDEDERRLKIELTQDAFTPVAVLKAFVKIGLTILPQVEVPNFKETLSWICEPDHTKLIVTESPIPIVRTFQPGLMRSDVVSAMVMRRRESIVDLPYAFLVLSFGNYAYQIFIPCPQRDGATYNKQLTIPVFPITSDLDPEKYGTAKRISIDLCGTQPVKGETRTHTIGFEYRCQ